MFEIETKDYTDPAPIIVKESVITANKLKAGESFLITDEMIDSAYNFNIEEKGKILSFKQYKKYIQYRISNSIRKIKNKKYSIITVAIGIRVIRENLKIKAKLIDNVRIK